MSIDTKKKASLIARRVSALAFNERVFRDADRIVERAGIRTPDARQELWKEWLNDLVATENSAEYRQATRDPGLHFLEWLRVRATRRFHVTWRSLDKLSRSYGPEIATYFASVVWPQEIAWAQRMRLFDNPHVATRAAMFLRETEGKPSKTFDALSMLHADAIRSLGAEDETARALSPQEIRFGEDLPDFTPLFLQYAGTAYREVLESMDRQKIELLAARARRDEMVERDLDMARSLAASTRASPMRHSTSVISAAISLGVGPNELYLAETAFVERLERGDLPVERGLRTPHAAFVAAISDRKNRRALVSASIAPELDPNVDGWEIAHLDKRWLEGLPKGYSAFPGRPRLLEEWKEAIVEGRRNIPYDRISDFGFYISTASTAAGASDV